MTSTMLPPAGRAPGAAPFEVTVPERVSARERRRSSPLVTGLLLVLVTAAAAVLRLGQSTAQSLRLDEGFSIRWAAWPLQPLMQGGHVLAPSLFQATAADVHPPGYLLLLHGWMSLMGTDLALLRLPTEVAATLAVPALFALAASLYGRVVGLFAALLGAFSPFWIWHAQEVRMYPFVLLFCILSTYGFVEALEHRRRWGWILLFVASVLAIYTQYFAFFILAAQFLFVLGQWRHYDRGQRLAYVGTMALVALTYLPWLATLAANYHGAGDPSLAQLTLYTPLTLLVEFVGGYLTVPTVSTLLAAWPLLVPVSLALTVFAGPVSRRGILVWLLLLVPVLVPIAISLTVRPFVSERYLMVCTPALYIVLAVILARLRRLLPRLLAAAALIALLLLSWHVQETSAANPMAEDYRGAVGYVESHLHPNDAVALDSSFNQDAFSYYSHLNTPVYGLPSSTLDTRDVQPGTASGAALRRTIALIEAGHDRLWVIYYLETNSDPGNAVRRLLAYGTASHQVIYGGPYGRNQPGQPRSYASIQLVLYHLIPRPTPTQQARPITMQEERMLTYLSPTLRQPFASPFGQPGARAPMIGALLAPPRPARAWYLPRLSPTSAQVRLTIFNPNSVSAVVGVNVSTGHGLVERRVRVPARGNLEIRLSAWGAKAKTAPLIVHGPELIVAFRSLIGRATTHYIYGLTRPEAGTAARPAR